MNEDLIIKIRENEIYEIIQVILMEYSAFLLIYAMIIRYQDAVLFSTIIAVFTVILDNINTDELVINKKFVKSKNTGIIKYSQVYRVKLCSKVIYIYIKNKEKPYKIIFSKREDNKTIEKAYNYIDARIKGAENTTEYE